MKRTVGRAGAFEEEGVMVNERVAQRAQATGIMAVFST
jgi:hypothetical protein